MTFARVPVSAGAAIVLTLVTSVANPVWAETGTYALDRSATASLGTMFRVGNDFIPDAFDLAENLFDGGGRDVIARFRRGLEIARRGIVAEGAAAAVGIAVHFPEVLEKAPAESAAKRGVEDIDFREIGEVPRRRQVRDDDDLSPLAGIAEMRHEFLEDGMWIEVLFGLVDNERTLIVQVDREVEQQQNNTARSRRQLLDRNAVIFDAVPKPDMVGAV